MKEINLGSKIVSKRKEKGITQDGLAEFLGVSKASVSKWETGKSYPDITILPQLASFFNLTIDELMSYEPQMTKKDIRKLYQKLATDFGSKPVDEVMAHCREIIKKYYSCFPLLLEMGSLILNYAGQNDNDKKTAMIKEGKELFIRVKNESNDLELTKQAISMEALCALTLGQAQDVLELLGNRNKAILSPEGLLASAHQMLGEEIEAKKILQVGIYQHIMILFSILPTYLILCVDEPNRYEETNERILLLAEAFKLNKLQPTTLMTIYILSAQGYATLGNKDKALSILENYGTLATEISYPLHLKGGDYFNLIDPWFDELTLGTNPPRDEKSINISIIESITKNPAFKPYENDIRFINIVKKLKKKF